MPARLSPREVNRQVASAVTVIGRATSDGALGAAITDLQALCSSQHLTVRWAASEPGPQRQWGGTISGARQSRAHGTDGWLAGQAKHAL